MSFFRLILLNLGRHRIRSMIGAAGIAFGVAAMLTVLSIVLGAIAMFEHILSTDSHYMVFERNVSDLFFSSVSTEAAGEIEQLPEVEKVLPILFGIVSSEGHPVITCFGVSAEDPRIVEAEWEAGGPDGFGKWPGLVYLGDRAAEFLDASVGEKVQIGREEFEVAGIFSTGNGFENGGVFMPLEEAQKFFHREGFSSVLTIKLRDKALGADFKRAIEAKFDDLIALENEEFSQSYSQFKILSATAWAVGVCAFVLGGLSVANTLLMSVFTRIREIAVLRVCGFSKVQVAVLILGESVCLAVFGLLAGLMAGGLLLTVMNRLPQFHGYVQAVFSPAIMVGVVVVAFVTSIAGALYPAWFAARIQPAEALRYE